MFSCNFTFTLDKTPQIVHNQIYEGGCKDISLMVSNFTSGMDWIAIVESHKYTTEYKLVNNADTGLQDEFLVFYFCP